MLHRTDRAHRKYLEQQLADVLRRLQTFRDTVSRSVNTSSRDPAVQAVTDLAVTCREQIDQCLAAGGDRAAIDRVQAALRRETASLPTEPSIVLPDEIADLPEEEYGDSAGVEYVFMPSHEVGFTPKAA